MLIVKPRDFTKGVFKFGSTPSGQLPTDEDLYRIITRGVYRTSMPEWSLLTERERIAVIDYIKGFSPEWTKRGPGEPVFIPQPPATLGSPESVARGQRALPDARLPGVPRRRAAAATDRRRRRSIPIAGAIRRSRSTSRAAG